MTGNLIVISGPSGVGKSTVITALRQRWPELRFSVSATTRPIRPTEVEGKNYYFVDRERFQQMIDRKELLEYAEYVGNYYGTPEAPIDEAKQNGEDIVLEIEVIGAMNVKNRRPDAIMIFIAAPTFAELERRLRSRGDTPEEFIVQRLERAKEEYGIAPNYDYIVVNHTVESCVDEIISVITAENCKTANRLDYLKISD